MMNVVRPCDSRSSESRMTISLMVSRELVAPSSMRMGVSDKNCYAPVLFPERSSGKIAQIQGLTAETDWN
jgi:hypothetical protein